MTIWLWAILRGNQEYQEQLKENWLVVKVEDDLKDYLSYEIYFHSKNKKSWLGQPHLLAKLEEKFGKEVHGMRGTKAPGTPLFRIVCPINEDKNISSEKQKRYHSA